MLEENKYKLKNKVANFITLVQDLLDSFIVGLFKEKKDLVKKN